MDTRGCGEKEPSYVPPFRWTDADLGPFDPSNTDAKIEAGHPVPCRLCEAVYRVLTITMRYCATRGQGHCQSAHGGWVGRRAACIQCGPHQANPVQHAAADLLPGTVMVSSDVFWRRLKAEFSTAPEVNPEVHAMKVDNWTQKRGNTGDTFLVLWQGGDTFIWETSAGNSTSFRPLKHGKVYEVWGDCRKPRNFITEALGVQNSKAIIALSKKSEHLMLEDHRY